MHLNELIETNNKLKAGQNYNYGKYAPLSVIEYKPQIWEEDGVWHTALGSLPNEAIWTIGSTLEESLEQFDKELQLSLKPDGTIRLLSQLERENLHKSVWDKINIIEENHKSN